MAFGSIAGALLSARRERPTLAILIISATVFGLGCCLAAIMPTAWLFGLALILTGLASQTFTTSLNSLIQLTTEPAMRGRVLAIMLAIAMGCTPLGAPIVGRVADRFGPRWALGIGAASGLAAAIVGLVYILRYHRTTIQRSGIQPSGSPHPRAQLKSFQPETKNLEEVPQ
jgi:MFS family permease